MLERIANLTIARRRWVLIAAAVAFVVSGALGGSVASKLSSGGFDDPDAEASRVEAALADRFDTGTPNIVLLVSARDGDVDAPEVVEAGRGLAAELAAETFQGASMSEVISYWDLVPGNPLASADGDKALIVARFPSDDDNRLVEFSSGVTERYRQDDPSSPVVVDVGGLGPMYAEVSHTVERDLLRAEMIAVPITLVLLLFIFRGVVAAALPLAIGALSVVGGLLVLLVVNSFTQVSVFALNLTTAMGLGLAIDYSLFMVSRFREELRDHEPDEAVRRTVATAGRTVLFSALTVAIALSALLLFNISFLRSFAYAGLAVATLSGIYAIVVLPAILGGLGHRVDALPVGRRRGVEAVDVSDGFWHRMSTFVMRRPVPIMVVVIGFLLVLGSPSLGLNLGLPDDRVLPPSNPARGVHDTIRDEFTSKEAGAASVLILDAPSPAERSDEVHRYAVELAQVDGVSRVDAETGIYCGGTGELAGVPCEPGDLVVPPEASPDLVERFTADDATYFSVVPAIEPVSAAGEQLVADIRAIDSPVPGDDALVGGPSAQLVDSKASLLGDVPLALAVIAGVTFVLLFLMFGSVVVPLKALILNVLSLSATFGAMVWIFQDGNGAGVLDFTPTGSLAATVPVLMFCVAFGLSMDYEVFLLSRIKEEHDHGADNITSVARGLERTGRIVTAAALLMSVVFLAFATSDVSFIKLFGIGLTAAVLLDAFVIRGTLVPAFMRLAGEANWWAPAPLRRIHRRFGISESGSVEQPARNDAASSFDGEPDGFPEQAQSSFPDAAGDAPSDLDERARVDV
ncbi:MAG: MMPL family transporter [Acidimicrobiales bacterium]|nr:MMPL family transporter [Acidimicrobiales bacterium]